MITPNLDNIFDNSNFEINTSIYNENKEKSEDYKCQCEHNDCKNGFVNSKIDGNPLDFDEHNPMTCNKSINQKI